MPPIPQVTWKKSDFEDPSLTLFNQQWQNLVQAINVLQGHTGKSTVLSPMDLSNKQIKNLGSPTDTNDAVSKAYADANYGATAVRQQMEILGKSVLQSMRRLNDVNQRETTSSFLNSLMSTAPTTNNSNVTFGSPGGGTVPVTISAGQFSRPDESVVSYPAFNDTVPLPTLINISTLARSGGVVTLTTSGVNPYHAGDTINVTSGNALSDTSFVGTFVITTIVTPGSVFQYDQTAPNASATGGQVDSGGVFYYHLNTQQNILSRTAAPVDTWQNRLVASFDGQTIIGVAVVNGVGGAVTQSAAGATPPAQTGGVRIFGRL